jgi:hypothetical protein
MYNQFATDKALEKTGVWLDYGDFRVLVARAGGSNTKYEKTLERESRPHRRGIATGTISLKILRAVLISVYAKAVVLDWNVKVDGEWRQGIHQPDGSIGDFSEQAVIEAFTALPDLFADVQSQAEQVSIFKPESLEEDAKNS